MNNVFVYCELEGNKVAEVSQELLTKGRKLANTLGVQLEAVCVGAGLEGVEKQIIPFGVDKVHVFDAPGLFPYTSLPHTSAVVNLFKEEKPQICLMGATVIGRDLGPRVSSALHSGLTADCTQLEIGDFDMNVKNEAGEMVKKHYEQQLYQIRPAFGGSIIATIVNPEHRPQMATVRDGVMKKEILDENYKGEVIRHDVDKYVPVTDYVVKVLDRHVEAAKTTSRVQTSSLPVATEWALLKDSTSSSSLQRKSMLRWEQAVLPLMQDGSTTTVRSDRLVSPYVRRFTSHVVSQVLSSTSPV